MKPNMKNVIAAPMPGCSQPKPAMFSYVTGRPSSRSRAATTANAPMLIAPYETR